jgi:hypothetical protein
MPIPFPRGIFEYPTNHAKTMMGCQWEEIRYW